jgi:hypothetical protein
MDLIMRPLVILVAVVSLAAFSQNATPKKQAKPAHPQTQSTDTAENPKPRTQFVYVEAARQDGDIDEAHKKAASEQASQHWWNRPTVTDWILAATTFCYVIVNIFMLAAVKRQADIAKLHAQAIVNAERPRLFIKIKSAPFDNPFHCTIEFLAVNRGRTPAEITNLSGEFMFSNPDSIDKEPKYPLPDHELTHKRYLCPDDPGFSVHTFIIGSIIPSADFWRGIQAKRHELIFFGHVVYRELITRQEYETRFCYQFNPIIYDIPTLAGGAEWNKHT